MFEGSVLLCSAKDRMKGKPVASREDVTLREGLPRVKVRSRLITRPGIFDDVDLAIFRLHIFWKNT